MTDEEHRELFQRLGAIETLLAEFRAESHAEHKHISMLVEEHDRTLYGRDSYPGLNMRVDRLEVGEKRRNGHIWAIWTAVLAAFGAWVAGLFGNR